MFLIYSKLIQIIFDYFYCLFGDEYTSRTYLLQLTQVTCINVWINILALRCLTEHEQSMRQLCVLLLNTYLNMSPN